MRMEVTLKRRMEVALRRTRMEVALRRMRRTRTRRQLTLEGMESEERKTGRLKNWKSRQDSAKRALKQSAKLKSRRLC
jgi:hypothetical protein